MIQIEHLVKKFGSFTALDGLTMNVKQGTVFGFVGPNGAGKSTTMSILATLLAPTSGTALVGGYDVTKKPKEVRKLIGYMPDFFGVYDNFKTTEYLHFYGASYGIPRVERTRLIPYLLELVNLTDKADAYVDSLSRGMKQRLCLARCLVHDPEVLILDEPASGLDPRARIEMREILKELKSMHKTIIISSHILPELAEMVDEIGVIENGRLIAQGNVKEIEQRVLAKRELHIRYMGDGEKIKQFLLDFPNVVDLTEDEENDFSVIVHFEGQDEEQRELLAALIAERFPIMSFSEHQVDLEDLFLEITRGRNDEHQ